MDSVAADVLTATPSSATGLQIDVVWFRWPLGVIISARKDGNHAGVDQHLIDDGDRRSGQSA